MSDLTGDKLNSFIEYMTNKDTNTNTSKNMIKK
jgi:hypothetical protein